jgi:Spy/CpxP family protein refolding chaperone
MRRFQLFVFGSGVLALAMISTIFSPQAADAQAGKGGPGAAGDRPRMHRMMGIDAPWISIALRHQSELNLSPDQVATLEKIRTQHRDQTTPILEQLRAVEGEIAGALENAPANLIQAKLKIEQAEKLRAELRYLRVEALENGKSVLTPEQRDQLKNLASARRPGFRKHSGQPS